MQLKRDNVSPTRIKLTITGETADLEPIKEALLQQLSAGVKVPGFRPGKAPANLVEKHIDQNVLQSELLDEAINKLYVDAVEQTGVRLVSQPEIAVTKFVPYETLEFTAEADMIGKIKLPDYKKIKVKAQPIEVTAKDVTEVLNNLALRGATKKAVERPAKKDDEVTIDFKGTDTKTKEPIDGADGSNYPLTLGSNSFIPGFEDELIGLKPGDHKTFDITFPADYGAKALQKRKVTFEVTVHSVNEVTPAKLDDAFAATLGPFKTLAELKADIKKQLQAERQQEAQRQQDNEMMELIAAKTTVELPKALVEEEMERMEEEEKRNVVYRGQTWQEHLDAEGMTAEEHREKQRPGAELRVKAGLILGEISQVEDINVTPSELDMRMELLKGQYASDAQMQEELNKPENRRDIMSRMLTEKTLDRLRSYIVS